MDETVLETLPWVRVEDIDRFRTSKLHYDHQAFLNENDRFRGEEYIGKVYGKEYQIDGTRFKRFFCRPEDGQAIVDGKIITITVALEKTDIFNRKLFVAGKDETQLSAKRVNDTGVYYDLTILPKKEVKPSRGWLKYSILAGSLGYIAFNLYSYLV